LIRQCSRLFSINRPGSSWFLPASPLRRPTLDQMHPSFVHVFASSTPAASAPNFSWQKRWKCIENCGACCQLDPNDRDLSTFLPPKDLELYLSMVRNSTTIVQIRPWTEQNMENEQVGRDKWCKHLQKDTKACAIYDSRPSFCRVQPDTFQSMYGVNAEEMDDFAIKCCRQQIKGVYGKNSTVMKRFNAAVKG